MPLMELFRGDGRRTWQLRFTDHRGIRRQCSTRNQDRSTALTIQCKIEMIIAARIRQDALKPELRSWVDSAHRDIIEKLIHWEILDARDAAAGVRLVNLPPPDPRPPGWTDPPASLVDQWEKDMEGREVSGAHAQQTAQRVRVLLSLPVSDRLPIAFAYDITADTIVARVRELRRIGAPHKHAKRKRLPMSPRTCQYYLDRTREFCGWLVSKGIIASNPLTDATAYSELVMRVNKKRRRRCLTADEQRLLINGVKELPDRYGMKGAERSLIYHTVLRTGLRANELHTLRTKNFNWWAKALTVLAGDAKAGREDTLPIAADLIEPLKTHLEGKHPETPAFTPLSPKKYCACLHADLDDLKIPFVDALGKYADFHALRHTYATELAKVVMPAVHKELMRHKDIRTTTEYYTHLVEEDKRAGLAKLPTITEISSPAGGNKAG